MEGRRVEMPTGSFPPILRMLDMYFSSTEPLPQKQRCLDLLVIYLRNIVMDPENDKFRTIKMRNARFAKDVCQCPGGELILLELGFQKKVKDFEEYLVLASSKDLSKDYWRVKRSKELMDEAILNDKSAPANAIRAGKEARGAIMRQIEQDAQARKQKQQRGKISVDQLAENSTPLGSPRLASQQASVAALRRMEALSAAPIQASTMLPTPSLAHLREHDYEVVYEPAEDSFALLDALQNDAVLLRETAELPLVLEVGSGTGIISSFLQTSIFPTSIHLCTDINGLACDVTLTTSRANSTSDMTTIDSIRTSLVDGLRIKNVDLLVFNPPYVPTSASEINTAGDIAAAWAGGNDGMDVTHQLLPQVASLLSDTGLFYLVAVARNNPGTIISDAAICGLSGRLVLERRAGREKLVIIRFHKTPTAMQPDEGRSSEQGQYMARSTVNAPGTLSTETRRMDGMDINRPAEDPTRVDTLD